MSTEKNNKYKAVLRDVAQVVVGVLVSETKTKITLDKPAIVNVNAQGQAINLQFIPMELVSLNPPISVRSLCDTDGSANSTTMTFDKSLLLMDDVSLKQDIFDGYEQSINPSSIINPNPSGLVGLDGAPLNNETPQVQNLF